MKMQLPAFVVAALFPEERKTEQAGPYTGYVLVDVDGMKAPGYRLSGTVQGVPLARTGVCQYTGMRRAPDFPGDERGGTTCRCLPRTTGYGGDNAGRRDRPGMYRSGADKPDLLGCRMLFQSRRRRVYFGEEK